MRKYSSANMVGCSNNSQNWINLCGLENNMPLYFKAVQHVLLARGLHLIKFSCNLDYRFLSLNHNFPLEKVCRECNWGTDSCQGKSFFFLAACGKYEFGVFLVNLIMDE